MTMMMMTKSAQYWPVCVSRLVFRLITVQIHLQASRLNELEFITEIQNEITRDEYENLIRNLKERYKKTVARFP